MNLETKIDIKRLIVAILGVVFLGFGVGMGTAAQLGSDCLASFNEAFSSTTGWLSFGQMSAFVQIIMIIITFLMYRKNIGVGTIIAVVLISCPIDFAYQLIKPSQSLTINILIVLAGVILISLGAVMIIHADLGMGPYEAFMYIFVRRFNIKFTYVKYVCDAAFLFLAVVFKGYIGLGTIINYLLTPKVMDFFSKHIDKFIDL